MPHKIKIFRHHDREILENQVNDFLSTNRFTIEQPIFLYSTCTAEITSGGPIIVHIVNSVCIAYTDATAPVTVNPDNDNMR